MKKSEVVYIPNTGIALSICDRAQDRKLGFTDKVIYDIVHCLDNDSNIDTVTIVGDLIFDDSNIQDISDIIRTLRAVLNSNIIIRVYSSLTVDELKIRNDGRILELLRYVEIVT